MINHSPWLINTIKCFNRLIAVFTIHILLKWATSAALKHQNLVLFLYNLKVFTEGFVQKSFTLTYLYILFI